jgi:hypothetical protein
MNLYILIIATILLVAIILDDPMDPEELARFYAPRKTVWGGSVISAPPLITGPPNHTEAFITDILPERRVHNTNGHAIIEGVHQISVPMRKVSGYVDPSDPPPLPGIKIRDANGLAVIEGTPQVALPPGIPSVVYGISLK